MLLRPWFLVLLCLTLRIEDTISAVVAASGITTTSSTKDVRTIQGASQTQGARTVIQPTNIFQQIPGIGPKSVQPPMQPYKRDLRPFEWLYKHLNDYLICAYGDHPDCEKKLAKSMELEESMSHLQNLRMNVLKQLGTGKLKQPLDSIQSNAPLTGDFAFPGQQPPKPVGPMDKLAEKEPMRFNPDPFADSGKKFADPYSPYPGPESKPVAANWMIMNPAGPGVPFGAGPEGPFGPHGHPDMGWPMFGAPGNGPMPGPGGMGMPYPMMPFPLFMQ